MIMELNAEEIRGHGYQKQGGCTTLYNKVGSCTEYLFKMEMSKKQHF